MNKVYAWDGLGLSSIGKVFDGMIKYLVDGREQKSLKTCSNYSIKTHPGPNTPDAQTTITSILHSVQRIQYQHSDYMSSEFHFHSITT